MIAIYTRLSKEDDESNSIENQKREGLQYANLNGLIKSQIFYYDEGEGVKGSAPLASRPALQSMMNDIKSGKITMVWTRKQSRISRKLKIFNEIMESMIDYDIKLFMGDRGLLDLQSPMTKMMLQIMAAFDEYAPNNQSVETKKSLHDNFKEGKIWGVFPYGYRSDENMMPYTDEYEVSIVNRIFNEFLSGKSAHKIAIGLNEDNVPTKYSNIEGTTKYRNKYTKEVTVRNNDSIQWAEKTVRDMLETSWYNGTRTYAKMNGDVPRIVDEILFNKVQQAIQNRKGKRTSKPKYNYLLKGLIRCDRCGKNYYAKFRPNGSDNAYICSGTRTNATKCGNAGINIPRLESFIIKHLFKSKDLLKMMESVSNDNDALNKLESQISELESQQTEAEISVNKYSKLLGKELKDDVLILKRYQNAKKRVSDIKNKLIQLKIERDDLKNSEALNSYKKELDNVATNADFNTLEIAVNNLIENITIRTIPKLDADNINTYIIKVFYKGLSESSEFWVEQPYVNWFHHFDSDEATPKQSKKMLEEGIKQYEEDAKEFDLIGDRSEFLLDNKTVYNHVLKNIILTDNEIVRFNKVTKKKLDRN